MIPNEREVRETLPTLELPQIESVLQNQRIPETYYRLLLGVLLWKKCLLFEALGQQLCHLKRDSPLFLI